MSRRVAIYARVSTEHEAQLSALDNQIQYYDELLKRHPEWDLYDRYIDEEQTNFIEKVNDEISKLKNQNINNSEEKNENNTVNDQMFKLDEQHN